MFKHTLVVTSIVITSVLSLLTVGCSTDQRYKREIAGNENYLQSPELRPLIVPRELDVPQESGEYQVYKAVKEGYVGRNVDIRPPALPLTTIVDSIASYEDGLVKLDAPESAVFWLQTLLILYRNNIAIERHDNRIIKTGVRWVHRGDEALPVEASYLLQRQVNNAREQVTIKLVSLKRMGQDISSNPIEVQRYSVEFFNMLMNHLLS